MKNDLGIIIQLPVTGFWGDDSEMDLRYEIEESLQEVFSTEDCGEVDGGDIGSGTMNIFTYTNASHWDRALELVMEELRRRHLLDRAVIAKSVMVNEEEGCEHTVVWPPNFQGKFSLI